MTKLIPKMHKAFRLFFGTLISIFKQGGLTYEKVFFLEQGKTLDSKVILITGGLTGIGLAMTKKFLQEGASVIVLSRNELPVKEHGLENQPSFKFRKFDLTSFSEMPDVINEVTKLFGRIDVLVNNAGVISGSMFPNVSEEDWDLVYETNSKAVFFLTQSVIKSWLRNPNTYPKKVLNISSQGAFVGATYPYRMTKWDIRGLTQGLAAKYIEKGIIINGIAPGIVRTSMQPKYTESKNIYCEDVIIGRICLPEEVAELARFMVSDLSNFIVGETILIDGGYSLK